MAMKGDGAKRDRFGYGGARDQSPTGSKQTKGIGGTGRVTAPTTRGPMDGNGGDLMSKTRSFDEGQVKGFQGASLAPSKGSAPSQPTDATLKNPSGKGMAPTTGLGPKTFPPPPTPAIAGPRGMGVDGGHGPKTKGRSTGGDVQKGKTGGTYKGPKGTGSTPTGVRGGGFVKGGGYGPMSKKTYQ